MKGGHLAELAPWVCNFQLSGFGISQGAPILRCRTVNYGVSLGSSLSERISDSGYCRIRTSGMFADETSHPNGPIPVFAGSPGRHRAAASSHRVQSISSSLHWPPEELGLPSVMF